MHAGKNIEQGILDPAPIIRAASPESIVQIWIIEYCGAHLVQPSSAQIRGQQNPWLVAIQPVFEKLQWTVQLHETACSLVDSYYN